jgi:hypothetical protein
VGQDGNSPGFPDKRGGPVKFQPPFRGVKRFPFPQVPGESLFPVSYDPPFYQKVGEMGASQGMARVVSRPRPAVLGFIPPGQGKQILPGGVDAHLMHTLKNFPVPQFPAAGKFGHRFPEGGAWLSDSQAKQMKFPGFRMLDFYFDAGDKKYPLLPGFVLRLIQAC